MDAVTITLIVLALAACGLTFLTRAPWNHVGTGMAVAVTVVGVVNAIALLS